MEPVIESKSPKRELEEVAENEPVNKKQCLESNDELKCPDQVEQKNKDEMSMVQPENNEDIENNCETALNSESNGETQKDILHSASKDIADSNSDDHKNSEEKSNDESNLNIDLENAKIEEIEDNKNERSTEVENNDLSSLNKDGEQIDTGNTADENQTSVPNPDQASSSSTQIPFREKCKYGIKCFRLNAEHKAKFSHPGDTDYNDPDDKPECPYGVLCYRKNPQHKIDYKHTQTKRKRTQNPVGIVTLDGLSDFEDSMEESVDESEFDESFIDDDDLDDEFDSDLEFDDMDEEDDENSDDEDGKKKKRKNKKNGTKEQKKKKTKND